MNSLHFSIFLTILFVNLNGCFSVHMVNFEEHNQTMRVPLYRQKTPREQQINSPLHDYGVKMEYLFEDLGKPKPKPSNRTNDSIAIYRFLDHEFYGPIVIGHPGQTLNVAFDTTWTTTWVISSKCNGVADIGCYFHNKYNHHKSSEYKPDGRKFVVNEGSYNLSGIYSYENISVAHSNVTNFSFVEMEQLPNSFIFNKADGVMGLGIKVGDYEPFFYTLLRQKKIRDPVFSVYINRDHSMDHGSNKAGNILLGFADKTHIKVDVIDGKKVYDEIKYVNVDAYSYWQFNLDHIVIAYNDKNTTTICPKGCKAIVDTSASTIIGPQDDIDRIHDMIEARKLLFGRYSVPCDTIPKLPKITFTVDGKNFTLAGDRYVSKITWESIIVCLSTFQPAQTEDEKSRWILGASFLSEVYTIYDVENKKLGLVRAA